MCVQAGDCQQTEAVTAAITAGDALHMRLPEAPALRTRLEALHWQATLRDRFAAALGTNAPPHTNAPLGTSAPLDTNPPAPGTALAPAHATAAAMDSTAAAMDATADAMDATAAVGDSVTEGNLQAVVAAAAEAEAADVDSGDADDELAALNFCANTSHAGAMQGLLEDADRERAAAENKFVADTEVTRADTVVNLAPAGVSLAPAGTADAADGGGPMEGVVESVGLVASAEPVAVAFADTEPLSAEAVSTPSAEAGEMAVSTGVGEVAVELPELVSACEMVQRGAQLPVAQELMEKLRDVTMQGLAWETVAAPLIQCLAYAPLFYSLCLFSRLLLQNSALYQNDAYLFCTTCLECLACATCSVRVVVRFPFSLCFSLSLYILLLCTT